MDELYILSTTLENSISITNFYLTSNSSCSFEGKKLTLETCTLLSDGFLKALMDRSIETQPFLSTLFRYARSLVGTRNYNTYCYSAWDQFQTELSCTSVFKRHCVTQCLRRRKATHSDSSHWPSSLITRWRTWQFSSWHFSGGNPS